MFNLNFIEIANVRSKTIIIGLSIFCFYNKLILSANLNVLYLHKIKIKRFYINYQYLGIGIFTEAGVLLIILTKFPLFFYIYLLDLAIV